MITKEELQLARECLGFAREAGASDARITLTKSTENLIATLDGEIDRVTRCGDRSLSIAIFADGRFGSFSTNKLERTALRDFIRRAADTVRMLAPDEFRRLPEAERCCREAVSGRELESCDPAWESITEEERRRMALDASVSGKTLPAGLPEGLKLISEEGEYSDSLYDVFLCDTQSLECRHSETSFDYGVEVTLEDGNGDKYSSYWWTSDSFLGRFDASACGETAVRRAAAQAGEEPVESGKYKMVAAPEVSSRLVSPLLAALNAYSIHQGNSFLVDSEGRKVFSEGLNISDCPFRKGESGSKLFDTEGVATAEGPIIRNGTVDHYFVNTYMAGKTGMKPTAEDAVRPLLHAWPEAGNGKEDLMRLCGDGILVTDFNGGNCNQSTGDFSYGISGQLFKDGVPVKPVNGMLITGNFVQLWQHLLAAGDDYRPCSSKLIPSLAFSEVDFSG